MLFQRLQLHYLGSIKCICCNTSQNKDKEFLAHPCSSNCYTYTGEINTGGSGELSVGGDTRI